MKFDCVYGSNATTILFGIRLPLHTTAHNEGSTRHLDEKGLLLAAMSRRALLRRIRQFRHAKT
jgi:hypothetical protein